MFSELSLLQQGSCGNQKKKMCYLDQELSSTSAPGLSSTMDSIVQKPTFIALKKVLNVYKRKCKWYLSVHAKITVTMLCVLGGNLMVIFQPKWKESSHKSMYQCTSMGFLSVFLCKIINLCIREELDHLLTSLVR